MFPIHPHIAPARVSTLLKAAEAAARAIPPAFPLDATIAVNPFLGQTGEPLATTAARLARVAGVSVTPPRATYRAKLASGEISDTDLSEALAAAVSALRPKDVGSLKAALMADEAAPKALPTVAELAARQSGVDWPAVIGRCVGAWAAGHFDRGQALWMPRSTAAAYTAWREWATHDLTPEIAGLTGFGAFVAEAPDSADRAILFASERLGLTAEAAETAFHRILIDLGGWAQHARWLLWQAELAGGTDTTVIDLLAIRLLFEAALAERFPAIAGEWHAVVGQHGAPVAATTDHVVNAIMQDATERAHQRRLAGMLTGPRATETRPKMQAVFCIDVRSEVMRRALEAQDAGIETLGFAGFFGLPLAHRPAGTDERQSHLPALLNPAFVSTSHQDASTEAATRIKARAIRAWGRFRQAAVSSFAFVEAAGPAYGAKLVCDAVGIGTTEIAPSPPPRLEMPLSAEDKAKTAAAVLGAMSLTKRHARLVLLIGHGAAVKNNPHQSAYHCGACCGQTGEVSSRLLASLLNDPETRTGLPAHGITLPEDTVFVAGLHNTVTDGITLYEDAKTPNHGADLASARAWLDQAGRIARGERAKRLPGATGETLIKRAADWAEVRPEWGLAGCAAFIAAPRAATTGRDLAGRAFLHNYDWTADEGFGTLELILTAPVVVASWISLQYYGSTVAPEVFGGGNKLIHNVVGGFGVLEGNGGTLRAGLPLQTIHDGTGFAHEPLRLSVMVEAPLEAILKVLQKHEGVRQLFDNGWLHLFALDKGQIAARYKPGLEWEGPLPKSLAA